MWCTSHVEKSGDKISRTIGIQRFGVPQASGIDFIYFWCNRESAALGWTISLKLDVPVQNGREVRSSLLTNTEGINNLLQISINLLIPVQ